MICAQCGVPAAHHEITLPANASRLVGGCPGLATLHSPRRHQRARLALRVWWYQQQRPTARSVNYVVDVERLALTVESAAIMAAIALTLALGLTIHEAAGLGWHDLEGAGWFTFCGVSIVAALLLKLWALRAGYR